MAQTPRSRSGDGNGSGNGFGSFKQIVADLPLAREIGPAAYRLLLLTVLNNVSLWYRPGKLSIDEIAEQIMVVFRQVTR